MQFAWKDGWEVLSRRSAWAPHDVNLDGFEGFCEDVGDNDDEYDGDGQC